MEKSSELCGGHEGGKWALVLTSLDRSASSGHVVSRPPGMVWILKEKGSNKAGTSGSGGTSAQAKTAKAMK